MIRGQSLLLCVLTAVVAALAFFAFSPAQSQTTPAETRGPYTIAEGDRLTVWRIDQATGKVSYCMRDSVSTDPNYIKVRKPYCSAWSD